MELSQNAGILFSNKMEKPFRDDFQSLMGMVHFLAMSLKAKYKSRNIASSFGNEARFFVTFRSGLFKDSMALVV